MKKEDIEILENTSNVKIGDILGDSSVRHNKFLLIDEYKFEIVDIIDEDRVRVKQIFPISSYTANHNINCFFLFNNKPKELAGHPLTKMFKRN